MAHFGIMSGAASPALEGSARAPEHSAYFDEVVVGGRVSVGVSISLSVSVSFSVGS